MKEIEANSASNSALKIRARHWALAFFFALFLHVSFVLILNSLPGAEYEALKGEKKQAVRLVTRSKKQLVLTPKPLDSQRPVKADYLAEHNQKVLEETKSHKQDFSQNLTDKPHESFDSQGKTPEMQYMHAKPLKGKRSVKPNLNLVPSPAKLSSMTGMPFNDHLQKVEIGAETALNTFEWKHATYFNRIKERVGQAWSPISQMKRYDPGGALIGQQDKYTTVKVGIDRNGKVSEVEILSKSGVFYLDNEAVRAFKEASPFPNPPAVMFASNETFYFNFGFHVSVRRGFFFGFD